MSKRTNLLIRLWQDKVAFMSAVILLLIYLTSLLAPFLGLPDPTKVNLSARLTPPGQDGYILGTDQMGRDLLSRLIWGGRISISVGIMATLIALIIGLLIGLSAGFFGGGLDTFLMRLIDILMSFPYVLLAIIIIAALSPGLVNTMIALAIAGVPYYARITRGSTLDIKEEEYVTAQKALGSSSLRVMFKHIVPNLIAPVITAATLDVGWMIIAAAGMSFLGLGAQPPTPEWGLMLSNGANYMRSAYYLPIFPGLAIAIVVLSLNLFGDGFRDAIDPKLSRYNY